jgi:pSer/pThr/pTyr-binding forkhead associated (FHA) protein
MQLRVISAALKGAVFPITGEYFTLGRTPGNTIHLNHASVSKEHAMLTVDKGTYKLWDLHSTNGVTVNGETAVLRYLKVGDRIRLGEVELLFEISSPTLPPTSKKDTQRLPIGALQPS